jgi:hypothetical protein
MGKSREPERSALGNIVREIYYFAYEGNYNLDHQVSSLVEGENIKAREYFQFWGKDGKNFIVKPDHIPYDPNIRAILFKGGKALIETTRVDFKDLSDRLSEIRSDAEVRGASIYSGEQKLIKTRTQNVGSFENQDRRTLLTIVIPYGEAEFDTALEVVDCLDNQSCYNLDYAHQLVQDFASSGGGQEQRQVQNMRLEQEISQLQVPKLALEVEMGLQVTYRTKHAQMLRMSSKELQRHISKEVKDNPFLERL